MLFFRRTKRGINLIDRISKRAPRFWKYYGTAGVVIGLISLLASFGLTMQMFYEIFRTQSIQNGPSLIAPGLSGDVSFQPGVSFIPIEYWIIGIGIVSLVHEASHGIVARAEGFNLSSVGWAIFGIFPAAFVEPEGEQMLPGEDGESESSSQHWTGGNWWGRLKVVCAGSFANYLTAALFILLAFGVSSAATEPVDTGYMGLQFGLAGDNLTYQAQEGFPAYESGMRNGTLESINGESIGTAEELFNFSETLEPGDTVTVVSSEGSFSFEAGSNQVSRLRPELANYSGGLNWFTSGLFTIALLNLLIGLFNMLPVKPLDGGWAIDALAENYFENSKDEILNKFSLAIWALLLLTLIASIGSSLI